MLEKSISPVVVSIIPVLPYPTGWCPCLYALHLALFRQTNSHRSFFSTMGNTMSVSFAPECTEAKVKYDDCFNKWYTEKFLQGKSLNNECTDLWDSYITCVNTALAAHKIKPMLDKAREDQPFGEELTKKDK